MIALGIDIGGSSVKAAVLREGHIVWTARSARYAQPSRQVLIAAVAGVIAGRPVELSQCDAIGLCAPGLLDSIQRTITFSSNLPSLVGLPLDQLVESAFGRPTQPALIISDTHAAAFDIYVTRQMTDRLLLLVIGTGVGAAVFDESGPLRVDGDSPGHLGQIDVSLDGEPVIGPDGGAGSLEGYLGAPALAARYGPDFFDRLSDLSTDEPPLRALVRALRIGHALYRPHHICLAGAIGNRLAPALPRLRNAIEHNLTRLARPVWTLGVGDHDFHPAAGAARLALPAPAC